MNRFASVLLPWLAWSVVASVAPAQHRPDPSGEWQGVIRTPGPGLSVVVRLKQTEQGYAGEIDIPAQKAEALKLEEVVVELGDVKFKIADVPGDPTFLGKLEDGGRALTGRFRQNRMEFPFELRRIDAPTTRRGRFEPEAFAQWCEEARAAWDVPGLAVAVVETGRPTFARGFGLRDVEAGLPVGPDTLFALGSSTKAFTGFLLATLAAEGKLDLDRPAATPLPGLRTADPELTRRATLRDFLAHRSGLPRHDLAWYGDVSRGKRELLAAVEHLEVVKGLREVWQYNNFGYVIAGAAAEAVTGKTYEDLLRERIFAPLGMTRVNLSVAELAADADAARGYAAEGGKIVRRAYRDLGGVAPAGAINASAEATARWVRLHLGGGSFEGKRLLSTTAAADLVRPVSFLPADAEDAENPALGYACGWFVRLHRGRRFVEHGGNIDGFTAAVAFFPDDGFGVVALANADGAALPQLVVREAADRFLDAPPSDRHTIALTARRAATKEAERGKAASEAGRAAAEPVGARALDEYAGVFRHSGYGRLEIRSVSGGLRFDLHGLTAEFRRVRHDVFAGAPGGEDLLAGMRAVFDADFDGEIAAVRIPLEPTAAPIVFRREPDPTLSTEAALERYVGRYRGGLQTAQVTREGAVLFVKLPGQPRYELVPRRAGRFALKTLAGYSLRFEGPADGPSTRAVFEQPNGEFGFERAAARATSRPTSHPVEGEGGR